MTPTQLIATLLVPIALALLSAMASPDPDSGLPAWCDVRTWPRLAQPIVPLLLAVAVTLAPSVAFAADDTSGVPSYVVEFALAVIVPIASALGAWLAAEAIRLIRATVTHTQTRDALERAVHAVETAVSETAQTMVQQIKADSSDGKLTMGEALTARATALNNARQYLGPRGLATLRTVLGTDEAALDAYLVGLIEAKVRSASAVPALLTVADLPTAPITTLPPGSP